MRLALQQLLRDDRAIEGLPVRLVIALVVGVASLGVMMNMLSGIDGLAVSELDARPVPEVTAPGAASVDVTVIDADGNPVSGATVVLQSDGAALEAPHAGETDDDGVATLYVDPSLGPNQNSGTVAIEIKPPPGSDYVDRRKNTEILVVADG